MAVELEYVGFIAAVHSTGHSTHQHVGRSPTACAARAATAFLLGQLARLRVEVVQVDERLVLGLQHIPLVAIVQHELDLTEVDAGEPVLDELQLISPYLETFDL